MGLAEHRTGPWAADRCLQECGGLPRGVGCLSLGAMTARAPNVSRLVPPVVARVRRSEVGQIAKELLLWCKMSHALTTLTSITGLSFISDSLFELRNVNNSNALI